MFTIQAYSVRQLIYSGVSSENESRLFIVMV